MSRTTRRARALASLTAIAGLGLAGAAVTTSPAQSAAPAGDCATAFPVDQLASGDPVTGLTVTHGTEPEGFTGEVLGVLDDGIGPDVDMVMVRLTSPEIDRVGIWQGMSGSPVYAADGRLIGAVSYGLAMGRSTVAGVTPFDAMDDHLAATASVDHAAARQIARGSDVPVARAEQGFEQLPMPLGVAGVGAGRLAAAASKAGDRGWLPRSAYAVGRAGAADTSVDDIKAGGNLAASMAYGDVTMAGVGTATSVCGDRVVGFGHPLDYSGTTTLALHPADAIYVQEDLIAGFKVANLGAPVGTITDDRLAGITGTLGALPATTDITSSLAYGDRSRTGVSHVTLDRPDALAATTFYELLANHQALVDGPVKGSEDLAWTITGTDADGAPFELSSDDLYASSSDLTYRLGFGVGDIVYAVARMNGVTIDSVTTDSTLRDDVSSYKISKLETRQQGAWVAVNRRHPLVARGGGAIAARVTLEGGGTTTVLPTKVEVPARFSGRMAYLAAVGGAQMGFGRMPRTLDQVQTWLDQQIRHDELVVALVRGPKMGPSGHTDALMRGGSATPGVVQNVLGPVGGVVRGHTFAPVLVR